MQLLASRLVECGFSVSSTTGRLTGHQGRVGISVLSSGIAWSEEEMLDIVAPVVPHLLRFPTESRTENPYLLVKRAREGFEIQLFPRMESFRLWAGLRGMGECGLTPDEKVAVSKVLEGQDRLIECTTDFPTEGCKVFQVGRRQYYTAHLPASEFVSRLRTVATSLSKNCYLPKSSIIRVQARPSQQLPLGDELGEWSFIRFAPKASNSRA